MYLAAYSNGLQCSDPCDGAAKRHDLDIDVSAIHVPRFIDINRWTADGHQLARAVSSSGSPHACDVLKRRIAELPFAALCSGLGRNTEHNRGLTPHNQTGKLSIEWGPVKGVGPKPSPARSTI